MFKSTGEVELEVFCAYFLSTLTDRYLSIMLEPKYDNDFDVPQSSVPFSRKLYYQIFDEYYLWYHQQSLGVDVINIIIGNKEIIAQHFFYPVC